MRVWSRLFLLILAFAGWVVVRNGAGEATAPALPAVSFEPTASGSFVSRGRDYAMTVTAAEAAMAVGRSRIRLRLTGANASAAAEGLAPLSGVSNYFLGNDPAKWRTNVRRYSQVRYRGVYPDVDLVYYGKGRQVEYDFVVAPGGDPATIEFAVEGAANASLERSGELRLHGDGGEVRIAPPHIYQSGRRVAGRFEVRGERRFGFHVEAYDRRQPLVIDPVISFSTYLGCDNAEDAYAAAMDGAGNIYLAGATNSTLCQFDPTIPIIQPVYGGSTGDAVVVKLDPTGSRLLYATYLGGNSVDVGYGIAVDGSGNAYIAGYTRSTNFPTASPLQPGLSAAADAFVTKINSTGGAIIYSTFLGGTGDDFARAVAVDAAGSVTIAGNTSSSDLPLANAAQSVFGGGTSDAFVARLTALGNSLVFATYHGGSLLDVGYGMAVDAAGSAYLGGYTESANFPVLNPLQATLSGTRDAFVAKFHAGGGRVYSTFLGGSGLEIGTAIAADDGGNAYLTGWTQSTNFPTASPVQGVYGGITDGFLSKLSDTGSRLVYSTFLGGNSVDQGWAVRVDAAGNAHVAGFTSSQFWLPNPLRLYGGGQDGFVVKVNAAGSAYVYTSYVGGTGNDQAWAVAVNQAGDAVVAGATASFDFPLVSALQPVLIGGPRDAFVQMIRDVNAAPNLSSLSPVSARAGGPGFTLTVNGSDFVPGAVVRWNGNDRPTLRSDSSLLQASILAGDIASAGGAIVTVFNPPPGGGLSRSLSFGITSTGNPAPLVTSLSPDNAQTSSAAFTLTVNGANFVNGATVRWAGSSRTTTFVSSSELRASINASDLTTSRVVQVTVNNPTPGGGVSNSLPFSVVSSTGACVGTAEPTLAMTLPTGFYIVEARNAPRTRDGYWGMEVLVSRGVLAGGFNLGGAAQENSGTPAFGAFSLASRQAVNVRVDAQTVPGGNPALLGIGVRLLNSSRQPIVAEQTGSSVVQFSQTLDSGFYIIEVRTLPGAPRATFQLGLNSEAFSGGVVVGGFVAQGLTGFGAFYVPEPQEVNIKVLGPTYGSSGANCMRLTLADANRNVVRTVP